MVKVTVKVGRLSAMAVCAHGRVEGYCECWRKWDHINARIGARFLSYLINGDASGLEDNEVKDLDAFVADITRGREGGHWAVVDGGADDFARCEVTHLMSQCERVTYNFKTK